MERLNRSLGDDVRLWREDLLGSRAWTRGLARAGVIREDEAEEILKGLDRVGRRLEEGVAAEASDEDVHSLVERLLGEEIGDVAGKLHTGRSRNDQVATDLRLWALRATTELDGWVRAVVEALLGLAERGTEVILPGYTHLQQGQPVRAAHWALSHAWPLLRDRERIRRSGEAAAVLPLGSGALAGSPFPIDREFLREELGFRRVSENSMDAVSDRDWSAELAFACALVGVHLSRLGEDIVLFAAREFSFLRIGDGYSTGSSLMPQKRNPDVAELTRGKAARLLGNLTGLLTLLKGLPTGYNRDLQEEKTFVFDSVDTLALVLPPLAGALRSCDFNLEAVARARDPELLATDLADVLVRAGIPFRKSHEIVGGLVREAERLGVPLSGLPDEAFRKASDAFPSSVREVFDFERSVEARDLPGGTSRRSVLAQIVSARAKL
jgi:argininosuccinate lyase